MYFEEKVIEGVLSWRNDPTVMWTAYSIEELSKRVVHQNQRMRVYTERMNKCVDIIRGLEDVAK